MTRGGARPRGAGAAARSLRLWSGFWELAPGRGIWGGSPRADPTVTRWEVVGEAEQPRSEHRPASCFPQRARCLWPENKMSTLALSNLLESLREARTNHGHEGYP